MKTGTLFAMMVAAMAGGMTARSAQAAGSAADAENAPVSKAHGGNVWVLGKAPTEGAGAALSAWLASAPRNADLRQKDKDGPWSVHLVAVFKKPCLAGPLTVQFFEKGDAKNVITMSSLPNKESVLVFRGVYDLSPDDGFNKNHEYLIKVGQLIGKKFTSYATGKFTLK